MPAHVSGSPFNAIDSQDLRLVMSRKEGKKFSELRL